jgi:asparagine synthase (glutamine-hydrolysing)
MCGIVGVFHAGSRDAGVQSVQQMSATIVHRGPDDMGVWADQSAAIGMRRLSIIDLATGHQPMQTDDGVVIVFNGEIYNYRALRKQLEAEGCSFKTHSDTEVILHLFHRRGLPAFEALEGMFGICIVDTRNGRAHIVRDRLGIKPLYYRVDGKRLLFGSEIKAILAAMPAKPAVDMQALCDYLALRYVPQPSTIWQGINKLPPGHRLDYDLRNGTWTIQRYWSVGFSAEPLDPTRDYDGEFRDRFLSAVESHLLAADVPVGILLSGGLDSSAVAAAAKELGIRGLHTFSVGFSDRGEFSELKYADAVARHIDAIPHQIEIGQREFIDFLPEFVWHADEPLADLASIPLHYVSRLARQHVKVVLSGEGADEILAGYNFERTAEQLDARSRTVGRIPRGLFRAASWLAPDRHRRVLQRMAAEGWQASLRERRTTATSYWRDGALASLWRGPRQLPVERIIDGWYAGGQSREPMDILQNAWCQDWLVEDLLMKADKMTMANSIELRVPFLTHSFVEWAQRLPVALRVGDRASGYSSKRILRRFAAARLPREIIDRPKQGFPVPAYQWLKGDLGHWASQRLADHGSPIYEWLDPTVASATAQAARAGDDEAAHRTWALLVLDFWARRWL